jgi:hypothetical protein
MHSMIEQFPSQKYDSAGKILSTVPSQVSRAAEEIMASDNDNERKPQCSCAKAIGRSAVDLSICCPLRMHYFLAL